MASEDVLMTDSVVLPDLIRAHATESPSHPALIVGDEIGWVDLRCPKIRTSLEVFGLARAPAVTSRRQKALRHFSQLGALNRSLGVVEWPVQLRPKHAPREAGLRRRRALPSPHYPKELYVGLDANRDVNCAPKVNNPSR